MNKARILVGERVGPHLNLYGQRLCTLAAFLEPGRTVTGRRPKTAAFPATVRIVDAAVQALGIEAHWVWNTQHHHLAVLQRNEPVVEVGRGDWNIVSKAERIVLIDPGVIARLGAVITDPIKAGSRVFVESPAFWAMVTDCLRTVERALALAPIEAREMTARQRGPHYPVAVDVAAANAKSRRWYVVDFG